LKIRTAKDVELLDQKIKDELGIDVRKYRNEEVAENFLALLMFPTYIGNWVIRPVIFSLLCFGLGFIFLDLVTIEYIIHATIGFTMFLAPGVLFGLIFLLWKMKKDIWGIADYSLDIMQDAITDLKQVSNQVDNENRGYVMSLLFKGILHIVTIPILSRVITEGIPFIGWIVNKVVKKVLTLISEKISFAQNISRQEHLNSEYETNYIDSQSELIKGASSGLEKIMNFSFAIVQIPLKILFVLSILLLVVYIYLIN